MWKEWKTLYIFVQYVRMILKLVKYKPAHQPDHFIYCSCCTYLNPVPRNTCTELGNVA